MMRRWLVWITAALLTAVVVLAARFSREDRRHVLCQRPDIVVEDSLAHPFVQAADIRQLLRGSQLRIEGLPLDSCPLAAIERVVNSHPLVKQAEVSLSPSGYLRVSVRQRVPILRVINRQGDSYFLDEDGRLMRVAPSRTHRTAVDVPVVTGQVLATDSLLNRQLYDLAVRLQGDRFWNEMIAQINVEADGRWTLTPNVCDFEVCLGRPERLDSKLAALRAFYEEALPKVGWDRYSKVDLEFKNQIVCTKK